MAAVVHSQSVKPPQAGPSGCDGAETIVGRKRRIAMDPDGRLPMTDLISADTSDSARAQAILDAIRTR